MLVSTIGFSQTAKTITKFEQTKLQFSIELKDGFTAQYADKKSYVEFLYICDEFNGKPKADGVEARQYIWVPLSELLQNGVKVFEKPFSPFWQRLLKGEFKDLENGGAVNKNKRVYQRFSFIEG